MSPNPYAAYGGTVVSNAPPPPTDPYAAYGGSATQPATPAATTTPPTGGGEMRPSEGLGVWADKYLAGTPEEQAKGWGSETAAGLAKSAGYGVGALLNMLTQSPAEHIAGYKERNPQGTDQEALNEYKNTLDYHARKAANWLTQGTEENTLQKIGALGEQAIEWMGGSELLKLVGPISEAVSPTGERAAAGVAEKLGVGEKLKAAQQLHATLKANPTVAGLVTIGLRASQDAAAVGAQTYAHTQDPAQAAVAAVMGGGLSTVLGGAQKYLEKIAPRKIAIGGVETPALASQVNEAGKPIDTGAKGATTIAKAQQQAGQKVIQNTAAQATANALGEINKTRPVFGATEEGGRMLPAPEGAEPFKFTLEGPGTEEGTEGDLTSRAEEIPKSHTSMPANRTPEQVEYSRVGTEPEYIQPGGEGGAWSQRTGRSWAERRVPGYMHTGPGVEGAEDVARGGGNLETTDPMEAESWLRQIEDLQASPEHGRLSEAQQNAIETQRQNLREQLGLYHASPYAQRFAPADIAGAVNQVRTFGDAASQVEAVAQPVYQTLDRVSGGDFNKFKEAAKQAQAVMQRSTTMDAFETAQNNLREANQNISDLIDRHRGDVSFQDYMTAKNAWRHAARLNELHAVFEGMTNGVTMEETDQGLTRVMTGKAKRLESYLADDTNRDQLEKLIGKDGLLNLKQVTVLLSKANTARQTAGLLSQVGHTLSANIQGGGWAAAGGAIAGTALARAMGLSGWEGAVGGAAAARAVLHIAATSPRVGNMVEYAVRNDVAKQAAPLITRTIAGMFEEPKQPEQKEGEQQ